MLSSLKAVGCSRAYAFKIVYSLLHRDELSFRPKLYVPGLDGDK